MDVFILSIMVVTITILCRKSFKEVCENQKDLEQKLNTVEMRLNALLEKNWRR